MLLATRRVDALCIGSEHKDSTNISNLYVLKILSKNGFNKDILSGSIAYKTFSHPRDCTRSICIQKMAMTFGGEETPPGIFRGTDETKNVQRCNSSHVRASASRSKSSPMVKTSADHKPFSRRGQEDLPMGIPQPAITYSCRNRSGLWGGYTCHSTWLDDHERR